MPIASRINWKKGGAKSVYVCTPDDNCIKIMTHGERDFATAQTNSLPLSLCLSISRARKMRAFTVPSGTRVSSAISS